MSKNDQREPEQVPAEAGSSAGGWFRRGRRLGKWFLKLVVMLIVTLVALEVSFHLIFPDFEFNALIEPDRLRWARFRPGAEGWIYVREPSFLRSRRHYRRGWVRIDERGFRRIGPEAPRAERPFRVVCLGDSVTFGWGLDDENSYPAQLSRRLQALAPGRAVEVINAGYPGYTSRQGLIWLDQELMRPRPDLVIVEFGFNDALPAWMRTLGPLRFKPDRELMRGRPGAWEPVDRSGLERINYELSFTYMSKVLMGFLTSIRVRAPVYDAEAGKILPNPMGQENSYLWARVPPEDFRENLREICELCQSRGVRAILVETWGVSEAYRREVREVGRERGVTVVSLAEVIQNGLRDFPAVSKDPRFAGQVQAIMESPDRYPPGIFSLLLVDYLHPNEIGATLFVDHLMKVLQNQP